jgi:glycosyltransferase involved in cell wall biosynthesis
MVTIMAFPIGGDSYTDCLYPALAAEGANVRAGVLSGRWLLRHLRAVDYVHINWPSFLYSARGRWATLRGFSRFLFLLALARWRGARIIWTVHNLYPHEPCAFSALDRFARWILVRIGARFFIHGQSAETEVLREFPAMKGRTTLIEHGHWIGFYANTIDRQSARSKLRLKGQNYVFLFIGGCRPYKNLEGLLAALTEMPENAALIIAGKFFDPTYREKIDEAIKHSPARARIHLFPEFLPDDEMQIFLNASDMVVAPYADVLTSGTVMLTFSFGRPIVAPARGVLKDVVTEECGILYEPLDPDGLRAAMLRAIDSRFDEARIIETAKLHDWRRSARLILESLAMPSAKRATRVQFGNQL